jgi:integrase
VLVTAGLDGLLIRNSRGGPVWPRTFHARIWRQATQAAGLPGVRFHDLRHFYASALIAAGERGFMYGPTTSTSFSSN